MKSVVVVESPAKAKTINKYLGKNFEVVASYGHIRDLPSKSGSVDPDNHFAMIWQSDEKAQKHIKDLIKAVKGAKYLYLATDPDREGEAISWHIKEVLAQEKALKDADVYRIIFHEITKSAVSQAIEHPKTINKELVEAYLARRALDYLVGFNLSPILWRKLPGARSAGRVQSVALRLIVEREEEREKFISEEFWTIFAHCLTKNHQPFKAKLTYLDGKKLDKLFIKTEHQAKELVKRLLHHNFIVDSVETKQVKRHPAAPFTTSTLQQEASRKLGFGAKKTMQIAQQLYEGIDIAGETTGLITYMRTDSTHLSQDATSAIRQFIDQQFGSRYLPSSQRHYKTKTKNAQEAHEAIRPTDIHQTPQSLTPYLDATQIKLYELIWRRAVASQMQSALFDQVSIDLLSTDKTIGLHATGTTLHFDGYLKVYQEGQDDQEDENILLPVMNKGEAITLKEVIPDQHFTQPSPRYTEASLVKKLEELGIGRPSTYATIISVLQDRKYVRLEKRQFIPEDRGRLVTAFLTNFFKKYVEYDFTAQLEEQLDDISAGERDWQLVLSDFWQPFKDTVDSTQSLRTSQVIELMENNLESYLFAKNEDGQDSRKCPQCQVGRLGLKLSRFGAFLGCSNYPECRYIRPIGDSEPEEQEDIVIGQDPKTQETIILKKGPYGYYLQWGEGVKPKRVSIPQGVEPSTIDLQKALRLKELPWTIGVHPETQNAIVLGIGRFGPYIKYQGAFFSFPKSGDFFNIDLEQCLKIIKLKSQTPKKNSKNKRIVKTKSHG